jgi:hypothetical protein
MSNLTEFQHHAAVHAIGKLITQKHFDITGLDTLVNLLDRADYYPAVDREALRGLHCVDYADMGPKLARLTREKIAEILGVSDQMTEAVMNGVIDAAHKFREPEKSRSFWRLNA